VTGPRAVEWVQQLEGSVRRRRLVNAGPDQLPDRIAGLQEEIKKLRKQLARGAAADIRACDRRLLDEAERVNASAIMSASCPRCRSSRSARRPTGCARRPARGGMSGSRADGKPLLIAAMTDAPHWRSRQPDPGRSLL